MTILALETTAKAASCAVLREGAPLATAWQCTGLTHSRTLMPMVADMLKNSELTLDELAATIHSHPTVTETMRECALDALGRAVHIPPRKK